MDYILNSQEFFHVCYVVLYYVRGVLSKDFEYVPSQHKQSYRFQDLTHDFADLFLGHCEGGMKLERVHFKMLQFPGMLSSVHLQCCPVFVCSVQLNVLELLCFVHLKTLQFPDLSAIAGFSSAQSAQNPGNCWILKCTEHNNLARICVLCALENAPTRIFCSMH